MKKMTLIFFAVLLSSGFGFAQTNPFDKINFIIGDWVGSGSGFGNNKSKINSSFKLVMDGKYIEIINDSKFEPTEKKPEGEHHIDKGFISYDEKRDAIIFRQFNIEGYVNQYVLNEDLSTETKLAFETESIENFAPGGKARWTISKISDTEIKTIFDVSFPNSEYTCFGTNSLVKKAK